MDNDIFVGDVETRGACAPLELVSQARLQRLRFEEAGYEEAVPLLREAIELDPTCAPAYAELSQTYSAWGLRRESSCLGIRHEINLLEFQSLYDLAYDYAGVALGLASDMGAAHRAMAAALRRGNKSDPERRAREALLAAELDPDDLEAQAERWRVMGYDPDDPAVRLILEREPGLLALRADLGAALCERGRYADALAELVTALKYAPDNVQIHYELAMLLDRGGMRPRARAVLAKARALCPRDSLVRLGEALLGEAV